MKTLPERIKSMKLLYNFIEFFIWIMVAVGMAYFMSFVFPPTGQFSQFPNAFLRALLGLGILQYMISVHIPGMTTREAVKDKNTTYGYMALAYSIVIAAVISTI